jgi:hypothetical protein
MKRSLFSGGAQGRSRRSTAPSEDLQRPGPKNDPEQRLVQTIVDSFGAVEITGEPDTEGRRSANQVTDDDLAQAREDVQRASALHEQGPVGREELQRRAQVLAEYRARAFEPEPSRGQQTARALALALAWARRDSDEPYPLIECNQTDDELAAEVIARALAGSELVLGRWWPPRPILLGLERIGITDQATIEAALECLDVHVQQQGTRGVRWRLNHVPELQRPAIERTAECGCGQRLREWRLASGGAWTCTLCHPPAQGLEVEWRDAQNRR